jgi:adenine-specific DNA-methyltransferase
MARLKKTSGGTQKKPIEQYDHKGKTRANNPPVGLVTPETDQDKPAKKYAYDPHLDPQLVWAGKAERTSFEVPTVSLHVHERIDPHTIIEAVRKRNGDKQPTQPSLFERREENPPLREAIDFYRHPHGWSNRLIAGDSLLVMNSLLEKEGMAGQVQMVYIDPPYGIKYGSNFQPFVNRREVKDGKDEDLTQEPEMIRAFRDTWELGIHSYLSYLRDRLWLAKELLKESGSCFVQISDDNLHLVRNLMDDVFGPRNFVSVVAFKKTSGFTSDIIANTFDYLLWYGRDLEKIKSRPIFQRKEPADQIGIFYDHLELADGSRRRLNKQETETRNFPPGARLFQGSVLYSEGATASGSFKIEVEGQSFEPPANTHWKTNRDGMAKLQVAGRVFLKGSTPRYVRYFDDFPYFPIVNSWDDTSFGGFVGDQKRIYVVQTYTKVVERCVLLASDPGDVVLDPTCGSGTTAYVAEQWGRRWITCDTSRVAVTLAKQRLMTALYDYYELAHPTEGVGSGFKYKTVPHVTLKSIANNEPPDQETLYDQPFVDKSKARVSGPFTVEAVPAPAVRVVDEVTETEEADASVVRSGETLRQSEWRDVILRGGVRGKGSQVIEFLRVEPLAGTRWLHADAETKGVKAERVAISLGPEYAPLERRQVERAWEEARGLYPRPSILLFVYSDVDPEAGKDIAEMLPEKAGMIFLGAKIDADVWTKDLKKRARASPSVWLVGQPDVALRRIRRGEEQGLWEVEIHGFDYYNTATGKVESGGADRIAIWMLDTDYDGRSLLPRQVFFPMAGEDEGWARLAKNLRAEIDQDLIEAYRGTISLPFKLGKQSRIAVKIVDDRGIESLRVIPVE